MPDDCDEKTITFELTDQLLKSTANQLSRRTAWLIVGGLALVLGGIAAWNFWGGDQVNGSVCVAVVILAYTLLCRDPGEHLTRYYRRSPDRRVTWRMNQDWVSIQTALSTLRLHWSATDALMEFSDFWVLMGGRHVSCILPKSALSSEVVDFIRQRIRFHGLQDYTVFRCSGCLRSLVGCRENGCPNCGKPIPYEWLGLTPENYCRLSLSFTTGPGAEAPTISHIVGDRGKFSFVSADRFWSARWIALVAIITACGVAGALTTAPFRPRTVLLTVAPLMAMLLVGSRMRRARHALLFGSVFSVASIVTSAFADLLYWDYPWDFLRYLISGWFFNFYVLLGPAMTSWLGWAVRDGLSEMRHGKKLRESTFSCLKCGYNLAGNASGNCPECGTALSFAGSGLTPQEYQDAARRLASPPDAPTGPNDDSPER